MALPSDVVRSYGGGAVAAQLVADIGPSDTSFAITTTTGWTEPSGMPLGTSGPFVVVIDRFSATVEKILCSAVDLVTGAVTVWTAGGSGRGYDGSTAQAHVPNGSSSGVQTTWSAVEAAEANQAVGYLLGTEGGARTPGKLLTLDGSGNPEWATVAGLESVSLYGVGGAPVGGTPPARLTGVFYMQVGSDSVAFLFGQGHLDFPETFPGGFLAAALTPFSTSNLSLSWYTPTTSSIDIATDGGFAGFIDISYVLFGW